jgi:hypothetical protein
MSAPAYSASQNDGRSGLQRWNSRFPMLKAHPSSRGLSHLTPSAGYAGAGGARNRAMSILGGL